MVERTPDVMKIERSLEQQRMAVGRIRQHGGNHLCQYRRQQEAMPVCTIHADDTAVVLQLDARHVVGKRWPQSRADL